MDRRHALLRWSSASLVAASASRIAPTAHVQAMVVTARLLGGSTVIPMHYGTFPILAGRPDQLVGELSGTEVQVAAPTPGGTFA